MKRCETMHCRRSYSLGGGYERIKSHAEKPKFLGKYLKKDPDDSHVIPFNDADRSVRFTTCFFLPGSLF